MFDEIWILIPLAPFLLGGFAIWMRHNNKALEAQAALTSDPDAGRMKEEIRALKDRIAVLERIATDERSIGELDREIQQLRDH